MKKRIMMCATVFIMVICLFSSGQIFAADKVQDMFSSQVVSSRAELEKAFYLNEPNGVSIINKDGHSMISIERQNYSGATTRIRSRERVNTSYFTYTVELASKRVSKLTFCEMSIFFASDEACLNMTQVYVNRPTTGNTATVKTAVCENGVWGDPIWAQSHEIRNASLDDTFVTIKVEAYGEDMDVYVDDEFLYSFTSLDGFDGYVGVRCAGETMVKSISLVENQTQDETAEPTAEGTKAPATKTPISFPTEDATLEGSSSVGTANPEVTSSPESEERDKGLSTTEIVGIVLGCVAAVAIVAVVVYAIKTKKK